MRRYEEELDSIAMLDRAGSVDADESRSEARVGERERCYLALREGWNVGATRVDLPSKGHFVMDKRKYGDTTTKGRGEYVRGGSVGTQLRLKPTYLRFSAGTGNRFA